MPKINQLPKEVYNRIAAGEVVERPASVVKELVENSIDAGATEIEIHIERGGKQLIRVVDNGHGIEREDLYKAFLPHATSKIKTADDLHTIFTLGFRGEALASIGSVAKATILSKTAEDKCYQIRNEGGSISAVTEAAGERVGTEIRVEMLFYNTPVRLGFLKTDKGEETEITTFVTRFILNRPDIAFTYTVDGKTVLQSFGGGEEEAFVSVYGAQALGQCYRLDAEKHGIRMRGYIGNQNFSKANKSYQSVFLNGRYINNATISAAVTGAYASYLMKRQYPFYVLHITVPTGIVDVNVHPNKSDVRFADNGIIYGCIYSVISAVLDGNSKALDYIVQDKQGENTESKMQTLLAEKLPVEKAPVEKSPTKKEPAWKSLSSEILEKAKTEKREEETTKKDVIFGTETFSFEQAQKEIEACKPILDNKKNGETNAYPKGCFPLDQIPDVNPNDLITMTEEEMLNRKSPKKDPEKLAKKSGIEFKRTYFEFDDPIFEQAKKEGCAPATTDFFAENKKYLEELDAKAKQNKIEVSDAKFVGKLFNTYLLYERNEDVFIIDQHAAHERLIFDRLKEDMKHRTVIRQPMLVPFELKLNAFESDFIRERMNDIIEMGFDIQEDTATSFKISAVPVDLQTIDLTKFFNEILSDVGGYRAIKLVDILKDKLASAACKAAVKGGMDLTLREIDELFRMMDGDMGLKCPHGRPVVVKMTRTQLEKMFKRIV